MCSIHDEGKMEMKARRLEILEAAISHTAQARPSVYGRPYENMDAQAELVNAYLKHSKGRNGKAHDMAIISVLIKIGRIASGSYHSDNYEDGAAYLAIAGEVGQEYLANAERLKHPMQTVSGDLRSDRPAASGSAQENGSASMHGAEVSSTVSGAK